MLRALKETVWEIMTDALEVVAQWRELALSARLKEQFKFGLVNLKPVDLLVLQRHAPDEPRWPEEFFPGTTPPPIRRERFVSAQPGTGGAFRNIDVCPVAQDALRIGQRMTEVVRRDGFKNCLERIGLMLAGFADEAMSALVALEEWSSSQTIAALAFLNDVGSFAGRTGRILLVGE